MTRVGLGLNGNVPVRQAVQYAHYAESQGLDSCWLHEAYWNRDALSYLAAMAVATHRLGLGTGCINPYTRHPVLIAASLASLDELSGGRVRMGFGTGYPSRLDEQGIPHPHPVVTLRESIALLRRLWRGEKVTYRGAAFSLTNVLVTVRPSRPIPVYLAGWGPRMLRVAGEMCEGYLARPVESTASCRRLIGAVRAAAVAAGRSADEIDTAAYLLCAVSRERAIARAVMRRDPFVVYQLAVIDDQVVVESGLDPRLTHSIADAFWSGDVEEASRRVGDELLDTFTLAGTPDDVLRRLEEYAEAGVRLPILQPVATDEEEVRRVIDVGREYAQHGRAVV